MENFSPGRKKNAITWEISVRAETECEGGNRCFLYLLLYTRVLRMRLWIFSPGWNFLSITWGISARSTGLKISSRVAQIGLKFSSCNRKLRFYKDFIGSLGWTFSPGWKSPCNQPLNGGLWALSSLTLFLIYLDLCDGNEVTNDIKRFTSFRGNHLFEVIEIT